MTVESLPNNMVYTEGADFWIVPEKNFSSWTSKFDWYVNFLMARANNKKHADLHEQLYKIMEEEELDFPMIKASPKSPLYISTKNFLPSKGLILVPFTKKSEEDWLANIKDTWNNLNQPKLRVFLPKKFDEHKFLEFCKKNINNDITYVREETYQT